MAVQHCAAQRTGRQTFAAENFHQKLSNRLLLVLVCLVDYLHLLPRYFEVIPNLKTTSVNHLTNLTYVTYHQLNVSNCEKATMVKMNNSIAWIMIFFFFWLFAWEYSLWPITLLCLKERSAGVPGTLKQKQCYLIQNMFVKMIKSRSNDSNSHSWKQSANITVWCGLRR